MSKKNNDECEVHESDEELFGPISKTKLESAVEDLVAGLSEGKLDLIESGLNSLGVSKEKRIYEQVGGMTRALHEALKDFRDNLSSDSVTMHATNLPDASNKLEEVIKLTEDSANKILALCETQHNLMQENLAEIDEKLKTSNISVEFKNYLEKQKNWIIKYSENNQSMQMTQCFQDLSGQALKKVIKLVEEVEKNLISILKVFGGAEEASKEATEEKVEDSENFLSKPNVDQDEADALLKGFGF